MKVAGSTEIYKILTSRIRSQQITQKARELTVLS